MIFLFSRRGRLGMKKKSFIISGLLFILLLTHAKIYARTSSEPFLEGSSLFPKTIFLILNLKPNGGIILAISNPLARIKKHSATNSPFSDRG